MAGQPLDPATHRRLGEQLPHQLANGTQAPPEARLLALTLRYYAVLATLSGSYSPLRGRYQRVTHPSATKPEGFVRLACIRHTASVHPEPGSNSPNMLKG